MEITIFCKRKSMKHSSHWSPLRPPSERDRLLLLMTRMKPEDEWTVPVCRSRTCEATRSWGGEHAPATKTIYWPSRACTVTAGIKYKTTALVYKDLKPLWRCYEYDFNTRNAELNHTISESGDYKATEIKKISWLASPTAPEKFSFTF